MKSKPNPSRFAVMALWAILLCQLSLSVVVAQDQIATNFTCNPWLDYENPKQDGTCPAELIGDGECSDPQHGGDNELCRGQDCIDCNRFCKAFDADCFGCLNSPGCYYCPGDATCQNSFLYESDTKTLSCRVELDFFLGGEDNPDEVCIPDGAITQDPLAPANDWAYKMVNVDKVWGDYTGKGVHIRINDDGVDIDNKDFEGRFDEENSCENFRPNEDDLDGHGTKVAGIVAANADNSHCAAGIAYESTFSACNIFAENDMFETLALKLDNVDISHNSIGLPPCSPGGQIQSLQACPFTVPADNFFNPCNSCDFTTKDDSGFPVECENAIYSHCRENFRNDEDACLDFLDIILFGGKCNYDKLPKSAIDALQSGVRNGRDGKGVVYVFAAGNAYFSGDDINMSGWTNSRYTLTVGAVGKDSLHADYSTPGAALFVSAPGGDFSDASAIMTTGLGGTCADSTPGTSFSAPIASGVIALMLEARPELTWRDVQGLLALTSKVPFESKDTTRLTNAAGFVHSNFYGFGIIDAKKAVDKALQWNLWTPEYQAIGESAEEMADISTNGVEYVSELTMSDDYKGFTAESTVVLLNLQHYNRGDLELTLVSPKGTESLLHPGRRPENNQIRDDERWKLMTVRNWGEDPTGTWTLKIKDLVQDNSIRVAENEFRSWKLVVYGRTVDGLPPVLTVYSESPSEGPSLSPSAASMAPSLVPSLILGDSEENIPEESEESKSSEETPVEPTEAPTLSPTTSPTLSPTLAPVKTLPPYLGAMKRPTVLVESITEEQAGHTGIPVQEDPVQEDLETSQNDFVQTESDSFAEAPESDSVEDSETSESDFTEDVETTQDIPAQDAETDLVENPETAIQEDKPSSTGSLPLSSISRGSIGSNINRPTSILPSRGSSQQTEGKQVTTNSLRSFGKEEENSMGYSGGNMATNLSLVATGVVRIPKNSWSSIENVLGQHTSAVVNQRLPTTALKSRVQIVAVEGSQKIKNGHMRNLQEDSSVPSITIVYNEWIEYTHGTEHYDPMNLMSMAFATAEDREDFIAKIHRELDDVVPGMESLVEVSTLNLLHASMGIAANTEASEDDREISNSSSNNRTSTVFYVIGAIGLWCAIMFVLFRGRSSVTTTNNTQMTERTKLSTSIGMPDPQERD